MLDHVHSHPPHVLRVNAARKDPTRTTGLRVRFEQDVNRRFGQLRKLISKTIVDQDALALRTNASVPSPRAFDFPRSADKVASFIDWLKKAEDDLLLGIVSGTPIASAARNAWTNVYIQSAYQRGLAQAGMNLRKQGVEVSESWVKGAFWRPQHADRAGLIYTRVYNELYGITEAMDQRISRTLAQGMIDGRGPQVIARAINADVDSIGRTRARTLARTEVIGAHAEASLNAYEEAGVEGVNVQAEFSTAGDDQVCPDCEALEGRTYSMDEARGLIPVHPNCRCAFTPVVMDPEGVRLN